jgi:hypothetical protein
MYGNTDAESQSNPQKPAGDRSKTEKAARTYELTQKK